MRTEAPVSGRLTAVLAAVEDVNSLFTMGHTNPLQQALGDFAAIVGERVRWCLIGGLAVGFHTRPRGTQDVDVLVADEAQLATLEALLKPTFRRNRPHCFEHRATGVEVEIVTPELVNMPQGIANGSLQSAQRFPMGGTTVPVVAPEWLIALKLGRASDYDRGDIRALMAAHPTLDLEALPLDEQRRTLLRLLQSS